MVIMNKKKKIVAPKVASYDFHCHSHWSYDARADIESYFKKATELGMKTVTLTDHHVFDGYK